MSNKKYEYLVLEDPILDDFGEATQNKLDKFGKEGWRLISTLVVRPNPYDSNKIRFYMMKELGETNEH